MEKKKQKEKVDLELRPHHVLGYIGYEAQPDLYYLSDEEYIAKFREHKKDFHSDKLILHWRDTIKRLHEHPDLKFEYVSGSDSVCDKCNHDKTCRNSEHEHYKLAKQADDDAVKQLPELKFKKKYTGQDIRKLMKKKGWLKEEK